MRSRIWVLAAVASTMGLSACGGDSGSATTTLAPMESSVFKTIPTTSTTLSPDAGTAAPGAEGGALGGEVIYEVQPGDYWTGIAQKYGCPNYLEIIAYNDNKEAIFPGDQIKIPATCGQTVDTVAPETGTTTTAAATASTLADDGSATYTILDGDTLSGIATKFNASMGDIISLNGWSDGINHVLIPGRDIKVPVAG